MMTTVITTVISAICSSAFAAAGNSNVITSDAVLSGRLRQAGFL